MNNFYTQIPTAYFDRLSEAVARAEAHLTKHEKTDEDSLRSSLTDIINAAKMMEQQRHAYPIAIS